ncbi:MAG: hypothetical protein EP298_04330 [Gammaproteobacteria bacterium]|nr:MAG: hypothetical protein EP298_04330 [Gammaproteobacteria bacterium]
MCYLVKVIICLFIIIPTYTLALNNDKYSMYMTNTLNVDLDMNETSNHCIHNRDYSQLDDGHILHAHTKAMISFKSDCDTGEKRLYLKFTALLDESKELPDNTYNFIMEFHHKNNTPWQTKIEDDGDPSVPFAVIDAQCKQTGKSDSKNCLNTWAHVEFDETITVTFGVRPLVDGQYRFDTLNLGEVRVTTAYGKPVQYDPISHAVDLRAQDGKYDIRFSKTQRACKVRSGELICPTSIDYYYTVVPYEEFVFACRQAESNDTVCPWTTKHNDNGQWQYAGY